MIARELIPQLPIAEDVIAGLFRQPKSLPPKLFYDAAGSALFERITKLPEYYLTRTEAAILQSSADRIAASTGRIESLVELGAATSRKTRILISAFLRHSPGFSFSPVDISMAPLREGEFAIRRRFPELRHRSVIADFMKDLSFLRDLPAPRVVLYLGSSIGNLDPMPAGAFLTRLRRALEPGDALLLGTDLRKSPEILIPAYDDRCGVTAAFNKNILARINRELGGRFALGQFHHRPRWNDVESRMEIYLESALRQSVRIAMLDAVVEFERGELIHTENSYKYTETMVVSILENSGWVREKTWTDERRWFAEHLARAA